MELMLKSHNNCR